MIYYRDLVYNDDEQFVWNCYVEILGREPDSTGFVHHVNVLRTGRPRAMIVRSLMRSTEGRRRGTKIRGARAAFFWARLFRVPGIGSLLARIERVNDTWELRRSMRRLELETTKLVAIAQEQADMFARSPNRRSALALRDAESGLSPRGLRIFEELIGQG
ncbi:DUF4214 domain-containing protein [Sphingobium sp. B11D3B]|uniref:DUF4214 domain-containing protein n=1 Tax=Sphingobium sp. B11D3B TaxID=2940575 RepID=UPI0039B58A31